MANLIGADIASELIRILREIEEMKDVMQRESERIGNRRVADNGTVRYCNRYDIFMERMDSWLTDEFMEILGLFSAI